MSHSLWKKLLSSEDVHPSNYHFILSLFCGQGGLKQPKARDRLLMLFKKKEKDNWIRMSALLICVCLLYFFNVFFSLAAWSLFYEGNNFVDKKKCTCTIYFS